MKKILLLLMMMISLTITGVVYAGAMINVNTASIEQLQDVKGIGPKMAEAIVAYRKTHGDFTSLDALTSVKGIGDKKLAKIKGSLMIKKVEKH